MTASSTDVVSKLWLHSNNLSGTLPGSLGDLGSLDTLNLGKNALTGAIPAGLGNASDLRVLFLQRNQLSESIPAELGNLSNLVLLNLRTNQLSGAIPSELGNLANLSTLNLMDNQLTGALPTELAGLSSLTRFLVGGNASLCRPDDATFTTWLNGIANTDALNLSVCEPPPPEAPPSPTGLSVAVGSAARTMTLSFGVGEGAVAANSQYRIRGRESGAGWTAWATLAGVSVSDGTVTGTTAEHGRGKAYEAQVRACGETQSDDACSAASQSAFGATRPAAPTGASGAQGAPPQTVLTLSWTIADAASHADAAYDIGYSTDTTATEPATTLPAGDVPAFTATEADVSGLAADTEYRLFVRSYVAWGSTRYFESSWASATASTAAEEVDPPPANPDRGVLGELHGATGGSNWTTSTNWLDSAVALNDWHGVTATPGDTVTELWLHSNNLTGSIPGSLGGLASLNTLNLGSNALTGSIPAQLGNATALEVVYLQRNQLSGEIPSELGGLTSATLLNLSRNQLSGEIPAELGQLTGLITLNLRNNQLTGALPTELSGLTSLSRFYVANNSSLCRPDDASFTTWLSGISQTDALNLSVCEPPPPEPPEAPTGLNVTVGATAGTMGLSFTQSADAVAANAQYRVKSRAQGAMWTAWATVADATASDGQVTGRTAAHDAGTAYEVQVRACGETQSDEACSGASASAFGATASPAPNAATADTTSSAPQTTLHLSWTIANADDGNAHAAYDIGYSADTTDTAPTTMVDAADTPAFATTETEIGGLTADTDYRLFVRSYVAWGSTRYFESSWASATASTAAEEVEPPPTSSDRGVLAALHGATGGADWTTSTNWLDSAVALNDWHGVTATPGDTVTKLWLHTNNLTGSIPGSLGDLASLDTLNLGSNALTGAIPAKLADATELRAVYLQRNQLSGEIPSELGGLTSATLVNLSRNQLTGEIPAELGQLTALTTLNLRNNQLTGALPVELSSLTSLSRFYVSNNASLCRPDNASFTTWLNGISQTDALSLSVCEPDQSNQAPQPQGTIPDASLGVTSSNTVTATSYFSDPDGDDLAFTATSANTAVATVSVAGDTATVSAVAVGSTTITIAATDPGGLSATQSFGVTVNAASDCPETSQNPCIGISYAYLTQAIQTPDQDVPLVAGRKGLLRVFATANQSNSLVPAAVAKFYKGSATLGQLSLTAPPNGVPQTVGESSLDSSFHVVVPDSLLPAGAEVVIEIDPDTLLTLDPASRKRFPATGGLDLGVKELADYSVKVIPLHFSRPENAAVNDSVDAIIDSMGTDGLLGPWAAMYPIGVLNATVGDPLTTTADQYAHDVTDLLVDLEKKWKADGSPKTHYLGIFLTPQVHDDPWWEEPFLGSARKRHYVATSQPMPKIIAHELGHNLSLGHAPCQMGRTADPNYPYSDGTIGQWGWRDSVGVIDKNTVDVMGHGSDPACEPWWISDYDWKEVFKYKESEHSTASGAVEPTLMVSGVAGDGQLRLRPAYPLRSRRSDLSGTGRYWLRGVAIDGSTMFDVRFDPDEAPHAEGAFVLSIPWFDAASDLLAEIVLTGPGGVVRLGPGDGESEGMVVSADGRVRGFEPGAKSEAELVGVYGQGIRVVRGLPRSRP